MRLTLTIHLPGRRGRALEVDVHAPSGATARDLRVGLERLLDREVPELSAGGRTVGDDAPIGAPPLLTGASLVLGRPTPVATRPLVELAVVSGPDSGRSVPLTGTSVTVGRSDASDLPVRDPGLSRSHVRLDLTGETVVVHDAGSTNGVLVDGCLVPPEGRPVRAGDPVVAGSSRLRLRRTATPTAHLEPDDEGHLVVHRSPRVESRTAAVTLRAPAAPSPPRTTRMPWLAALLPLPVSAVMAALWGPQLLAFALLGPVMMLGTSLGDRLGSRRTQREDRAAYGIEMTSLRGDLADALRVEVRRRDRAAPDAAELLALVEGPTTRLWERSPGDPDWGVVRIGRGTVPAETTWVEPGGAPSPALGLPDGPVTVDATTGVGIHGPAEATAGIVRHVVGQLVALHSPDDLVVWAAVPDTDDWDWVGRLPHTVLVARDREGRAVLASELAASLAPGPSGPADETDAGRCHLVVAPAAHDLGSGIGRVLEDSPRVAVVAASSTPAGLPTGCRAVLDLTDPLDPVLRVHDSAPVADLVVDGVGWWWAERLSRALAPLRDGGTGERTHLPDSITLADLLGLDLADADGMAEQVGARWRSGGVPAAVLGHTGSGPWVVDLRTDGPHVLVGGTTGAGKSELLQTLVASLALACSPEDLTFVLVDYKGGAAFGACSGLPHTVGLVTDLDEHLTERARVSLSAELKRRERILATVGAKDLEDYRRRAGPADPPLPRLVIVIDEFRLLADELPDFITGIVQIAAVGRSLGVHLVLATQRPAGAVTADIQANVNLRIALRMRDASDSHDVIESDAAARISSRTPGRGLARTGAGETVRFQSARVSVASGGGGDVLVLPAGVAPPRSDAEEDGSDLRRIVDAARRAHDRAGHAQPHCPWRPALPSAVPLPGGGGVGLVDLPRTQSTEQLVWEPGGHWLVAGGPRSGRTGAVRGIVAAAATRWGPGDLHVYAVDGASALAPLAALPHTGAVIRADETHRLARLVERLGDEVLRRSARMAALGVGDLAGWQALHRCGGCDESAPAQLLLVVDGWDRVAAATEGIDHGEAVDGLLGLLRDGSAAGLSGVVTGDRSLLTGRVAGVASTSLVLPLADPGDVALVGLSRREVPHHWPPGRAVRVHDRVEVQLAHLGATPDPADQASALAALAARCRELHPPPGPRAPVRLQPLPATVATDELPPPRVDALPIGLGGDAGAPVCLDVAETGRQVLVAGPSRSGRTTALAAVGLAALAAGLPCAAVEPRRGTIAGTLAATLGPAGAVCVGAHDIDPLVAARRAHRDLVLLVDDAEALDGTPVEPVAREILALVDRDEGLVVAASSTTALLTQLRGLAVEIARRQTGILLGPATPADGDALGIRAPRGFPRLPGRGLLVVGGRVTEVQVARGPSAAVRADGAPPGSPARSPGGDVGP